jgi:hypothetical protein
MDLAFAIFGPASFTFSIGGIDKRIADLDRRFDNVEQVRALELGCRS